MRRINSRIYFLIIAILLFILSVILLLTLNVQGIQYSYFTEYNIELICMVKGVYTIFGGSLLIEKGYIIKNNFYVDKNLCEVCNFRFDYLTFMFIILTFVSIILIYVFYYQKLKLLFSTLLFSVSIIGVSFQPTFLWIISGGNKNFDKLFSPYQGNGIVGIGAIAYITIMSAILVFLIVRIFYLYLKKLTID